MIRNTPPPPPVKGPTPGRPLVLVVEDEAASATALQDALINASCDVDVVGSAEHALEKLGEWTYSLAIVDVMLPDLDGRALLGRMAQNPNWLRIPAIVVSGHTTALPHNAVAFLKKPINSADLLTLVQRYARRGPFTGGEF